MLPDSILGAPGLGYIRQWLIKSTYIMASLDLHADTFQPKNGTQTSILILQKKTKDEIDNEEKSGRMKDYAVFMAMVERVGHDKRGNPVFKRDVYGNEILVSETSNIPGPLAGEEKTVVTSSKVRVIDDQTILVPLQFQEWKKKEGVAW